MRPAIQVAPATINSMTGGTQSFFAAQQHTRSAVPVSEEGKVEKWIGSGGGGQPVSTLPGEAIGQPKFGAPPNFADATKGKAPLSTAAAKLLAKTANEKIATFNNAIRETTKVTITPEAIEAAESTMDPAVRRAHLAERAMDERQRIKKEATRIRVTILACKHLPKMDTFGNTDAFCLIILDNKKAGGQRMKRKTKVVKNDLNPEFSNQSFVFNVYDYPTQELSIEVWDWDAGSDDERIGAARVPLAQLEKEEDKLEAWYEVKSEDNEPVWGHDGSKTIVRVRLEKNVDPSDVGLSVGDIVPDRDEVRVLDCTKKPWESATRGFMFDVENVSEHPVLVTGMQAAAGRGKDGPCSYTIYRTLGTWNVERCPCNKYSPCKYLMCCCGSFPSGRPNFRCMKCCCRYAPCTSTSPGCCCWGECGPGHSLAEPCCEGCVPCCTGDCVCNYFIFPCVFPLMSCGCGCCAGEDHGGLGVPGIPGFRLCTCCGCPCCRNGLHRQYPTCYLCWLIPCNCTCNATCCSCCRSKFFDRRRWTRVTAGRVDLPSDWGEFAKLPSFQDFEGGGVLIPPGQKVAFYIHTPYPEDKSAEHALAVRGPFTREYKQGDATDQDDFLKIHTGPITKHAVPFANSHRIDSKRDGQYYRLANQKLDQYQVCAFVGKIEYSVLAKDEVPKDCVTFCGERPCTYCC